MSITGDEVIGASLAHYGEWAEEELYLLSSFIRPADTVVDVGANIGTHTIAFSRFVGPTGCVLSIDGQRRAFALLTLNTFLNAAENVRCVHAIVGKENGLRMVPEEDPAALRNLGCFSFAPAEAPAPNDRSGEQLLFPLSVIALDELHLPKCELVKIDAEGMELEVMFGAIRTLERFRPVIYFEQTSERSFLQTFEFLHDISYDAFWHVIDPFNRNNLRGCSHNIFGGTREVMVLALPRRKEMDSRKAGSSWMKSCNQSTTRRAIRRPIQAGHFLKEPTEIFLQLIPSGSRAFWKKFAWPSRINEFGHASDQLSFAWHMVLDFVIVWGWQRC